MERLEKDAEFPGIIILRRESDYFELVAVKEHRPYDVVMFTNLMAEE
jgi:hypothetical protein